MAAHQEKARRLNATIVFLDESGFMLQPLVRWTCGQTPVVRCRDRRDRLSVIAGVLAPPDRKRHRLSACFRIHGRNVRTAEAVAFLRNLDRQVRGPLVVVQDRLNVHKAAAKRWLAGRPPDAPCASVERLPPYAPDLNPTEQIWNHGRRVDLANLAPVDSRDLRRHVRRSMVRQRHRPNLLASFFDHAGLSL